MRAGSEFLDIKELIAGGHFELANVLCDSKINCLLGIKENIFNRMRAPFRIWNGGVCPKDFFGSRVLETGQVSQGFEPGSIGAYLCREMRLMDHKAGLLTGVPIGGSQVAKNGD
jgi:hypothetical protein